VQGQRSKKKARVQHSKDGHAKVAKAGPDLAKEPVQIIPDAVQERGLVSAGQVELDKLAHNEKHEVAMAVAEEKSKALGEIMEHTATTQTKGLKAVVEMQMKGKMDVLEREYALKKEMEQASREHESIERLVMMYTQAGKGPSSAYKATKAAVRPKHHEPE
jgi:predicted membrane-bound mannosyltransferase